MIHSAGSTELVYGFDADRATRADRHRAHATPPQIIKLFNVSMQLAKQGSLDSTLSGFPSLAVRV
jgi:hypothetical protein